MIEGTTYYKPGLIPDAAPRAHLRETNFLYKEELLEQFRQRVGPNNLICLIRYGSKVTGDATNTSKEDIIAIVKDERLCHEYNLAQHRKEYGSPKSPRLHAKYNEDSPNYYQGEITLGGKPARAKYITISLKTFIEGCNGSLEYNAKNKKGKCGFYVAGRMQKEALELIPAVDDTRIEQIHQAINTARNHGFWQALAMVPDEFSPDDLTQQYVSLSYVSDLRFEKPNKIQTLISNSKDGYRIMMDPIFQAFRQKGFIMQVGENKWRKVVFPREEDVRKWLRYNKIPTAWQNYVHNVLTGGIGNGIEYAHEKTERAIASTEHPSAGLILTNAALGHPREAAVGAGLLATGVVFLGKHVISNRNHSGKSPSDIPAVVNQPGGLRKTSLRGYTEPVFREIVKGVPLSATKISILGLGLGIAANFLLERRDFKDPKVRKTVERIGAAMLVGSGVCDVLDGPKARADGTDGRKFGKLLDAGNDRLVDGALAVAGLSRKDLSIMESLGYRAYKTLHALPALLRSFAVQTGQPVPELNAGSRLVRSGTIYARALAPDRFKTPLLWATNIATLIGSVQRYRIIQKSEDKKLLDRATEAVYHHALSSLATDATKVKGRHALWVLGTTALFLLQKNTEIDESELAKPTTPPEPVTPVLTR